ncbi:MAG TPA: hypothetical protein VIK98_08890 [Limnochordales bacterium]
MRLEDDGSYSDDEDAVGAGGPFRGTATINFGAPGTYEVRISGESRAAVPGGMSPKDPTNAVAFACHSGCGLACRYSEVYDSRTA